MNLVIKTQNTNQHTGREGDIIRIFDLVVAMTNVIN